MRRDSLGDQPGAALARPAHPSRAALPPGPAHRSSQRLVAALDGCCGQRQRDQLAALVLHARRDRPAPPAIAPGVAAGQHGGVRRPAAGCRAGVPTSSSTSTSPGRATSVTAGAALSAASSVGLGRPPVAAERVARTPGRSTAGGCARRRGARPGRSRRRARPRASHSSRSRPATRRSTALTSRAGARPTGRARQRRRWSTPPRAAGSACAAAGGSRAAGRRAASGSSRADRPVEAGGEDRVVLPWRRSVPCVELGGERGVPARQPALAQQPAAARG